MKFWRGPCPRDPGMGRTGPSQGPPLVGTGTHPVKGAVRAGAGGWDSRGRSFQNTHYEDERTTCWVWQRPARKNAENALNTQTDPVHADRFDW